MNSARIFLFCAGIFSMLLKPCMGQDPDAIYGIFDDENGSFYFSKVSLTTGIRTDYVVASTSITDQFSSDVNAGDAEYFLCTGKFLKTYDANTGSLLSTDSLPIASNEAFQTIRYNPCDSSLYGIVIGNPNNSFASFQPSTGIFNTIAALSPQPFSMGFGNMSVLDVNAGLFVLYNTTRIIGLDIQTGQVVFSHLVVDLPGESFFNLALKCGTHELFGTSADATSKYLVTVDPSTGNLTHVSGSAWTQGHGVPVGGGQCINESTEDYFYSGSGCLIRINSVSGSFVSVTPINPGEMNFIQTFAPCQCTPSGLQTLRKEDISILPSPFSDHLSVTLKGNMEVDFVLYDLSLREMFRSKINGRATFDTGFLDSGMYLYSIVNSSGNCNNGTIVKQ